jgi:CAAX protease family protein
VSISSGPSRPFLIQSNPPASKILYLAIAGETALALLAVGLGRLLRQPPLLSGTHAGLPALLWGVLETAPLLMALSWILRKPTGPLRDLVEFVLDQLGPMVTRRSGAELALLAASAGFSEELLFRGVLQNGLAGLFPKSVALILTSLAFGLAHHVTRTYAILAGIMGFYLGGLLLVHQNLLIPVITHALYDFVALLLLADRYRTSRA